MESKDGSKDRGGRPELARKRTNLATERTNFANERTFMAYARTAFAMVVVGLTMLEFFDRERYRLLSLALIPLGVAVAIFGFVRFWKKRKLIRDHSLRSYRRKYE